jgi:hypothetical protein
VDCLRVTEQRVTSNCVVELMFTGEAMVGRMGVLGCTVIRATDEVGNDLCPPGGQPFVGSGVAGDRSLAPLRGWFDVNAHRQQRRYSSVSLRPAAHAAKQIRELQGELLLYSPTYTNGGVVVCADFLRTPGTEFNHPGLESAQVHLTWHTKETYQARQRTAAPPRAGPDPAGLFVSRPGEAPDAAKNYFVLHAADPEKQIVGFALREPGGKFLPVSSRNSAGDYHGLYFDELLPEKVDLFVYLATPGAVEAVPFKFENLPLP